VFGVRSGGYDLRRTTKFTLNGAAALTLLIGAFGVWCAQMLSHCVFSFKLGTRRLEVSTTRGKLQVLQLVEVDDGTIRLVVSVLDEQGNPVTNIEPKDVEVVQAGHRRTDLQLSPVGIAPLSVGLALDVSSSMGQPPAKFLATQTAALSFIDAAGEAAIAVYAFGDGVQRIADFTQPVASARRGIRGLLPSGKTSLYECIDTIGRVMADRPGRKAVIVLSDGYDTQGRVSKEEAILACRQAGVPLFTIGLGYEADVPALQEMAERTRGQLYLAPSPRDLQGVYGRLARLLQNQFYVVFDSSVVHPRARWLFWGLSLLVFAGAYAGHRSWRKSIDCSSPVIGTMMEGIVDENISSSPRKEGRR